MGAVPGGVNVHDIVGELDEPVVGNKGVDKQDVGGGGGRASGIRRSQIIDKVKLNGCFLPKRWATCSNDIGTRPGCWGALRHQ